MDSSKNYFTKLAIIASFFFVTPCLAQSNSSITEEYKKKIARNIDIEIAKHFNREKLTIPERVNDEKLLRRTYLTLTGRIPTLEEINAYLTDDNPQKKETLIKSLLNSEGYKSHMTNYYFDLFRAKDNLNNNSTASPYQGWLRQSINNNKPWDKLVSDLITAQGNIWSNGAVGYYIRDKGMELDNLSNSMRLFTGTRMECAQCHDHPFTDMERIDFYRATDLLLDTLKTARYTLLELEVE